MLKEDIGYLIENSEQNIYTRKWRMKDDEVCILNFYAWKKNIEIKNTGKNIRNV